MLRIAPSHNRHARGTKAFPFEIPANTRISPSVPSIPHLRSCGRCDCRAERDTHTDSVAVFENPQRSQAHRFCKHFTRAGVEPSRRSASVRRWRGWKRAARSRRCSGYRVANAASRAWSTSIPSSSGARSASCCGWRRDREVSHCDWKSSTAAGAITTAPPLDSAARPGVLDRPGGERRSRCHVRRALSCELSTGLGEGRFRQPAAHLISEPWHRGAATWDSYGP